MLIGRLAQAARLLLGLEYVVNGLNWWWKILPFPSVSDPPLKNTPPFVQAMIDTDFMFAGTKVIEVVTGVMLLADLWVPLALVVAFPVTVGIWSVDFLLIPGLIRAQVLGWSVLLLNAFLLLAYLSCYRPMLVAKAKPFGRVDVLPKPRQARGESLRKGGLAVLGIASVVLGVLANGWCVVMIVQRFAT